MKAEATKAEAEKADSIRKSFTSPKHGQFQEPDKEIMEYVHLKRNMECCLHVRQ